MRARLGEFVCGLRRQKALHRSAVTILCCGTFAVPVSAPAQDIPYQPRNAFGEIGILDTPSAFMVDDGQIAMTAGLLPKTQRVNFTFQVLPWFEGTFRYSHLSEFGSTGNYYDRSLGMKIRLWQEGRDLPSVSLGVRDLLGTGVYGSEYAVASKHVGDFEFSAGVGWGRMADNATFINPFGLIAQSFKVRPPFSGKGGTVSFSQFFHGPHMGVFGGAVWHTPIRDLDLLVEYSGDKYKAEVATGNMSWRAPVNVGLSYRPMEAMQVSAGLMYGTTWGATVSFATDPTRPLFATKIDAAPLPVTVRDARQQSDALAALTQAYRLPPPHAALWQAMLSETPNVRDIAVRSDTLQVRLAAPSSAPCSAYARVAAQIEPELREVEVSVLDGDATHCAMPLTNVEEVAKTTTSLNAAIRKAARDQGLAIKAMSLGPNEIIVYYRNLRYFAEDEAAGRLARVLMAKAPPGVEIFRLIVIAHGEPLRQFYLSRSDLEHAQRAFSNAEDFDKTVTSQRPPLNNPVLEAATPDIYPSLAWSLQPRMRQSLFDPNSPYQVQFLGSANGSVELLPGLTAETRLDLNFWNNFNTDRVSNSQLPHVRSDIDQYFKHGASGISNLALSYRTRLEPTVFAKLTAGYLEDMFAGVGGEVLWRPAGSRLSVGADLYQVWQRGFDRLFDLQSYHVLTGHISLYYESPWMGLNFNVHAGRYLAGDYGATVEFTRRFADGVEIGAYATFTNVPFSKYGEGSFDKGIILHLPLEWGLPIYSTNVFDATLRSLSRDGGQRLLNDDSLAEETKRTSDSEIDEHLDKIVSP